MSKQAKRPTRHSTWTQSYSDRAALPDTSPLAAYLFNLMAAKRTNLCLSADVESTSQLLDLAEECGDCICVFKTHADIVHDFGERAINGLVEIAARKKFLIFEDRKFGDIGNTVQAQYAAGPLRIAAWANLVNAHVFPGPAIVTALKSAAHSAVAWYNSSMSTEITGGTLDADTGSYFPRNAVASGSSSEEEDDDDDDDDETDSSSDEAAVSSSRRQGRPQPLDLRASNTSAGASTAKSVTRRETQGHDRRQTSVVTISTTISSSTEYTSPPLLSASSSRSAQSLPVPLRAPSFASSASTAPASDPSTPLGGPPLARGLLLVAQMSSADNLCTPAYTARCVELAQQHRDFVLGFVAQRSLNAAPRDNFVVMTPGVRLAPASAPATASASTSAARGRAPPRASAAAAPAAAAGGGGGGSDAKGGGDGLGQQYKTPRDVVLNEGVDVVIVGRGILNADDRRREAEGYRREAWSAYMERTAG